MRFFAVSFCALFLVAVLTGLSFAPMTAFGQSKPLEDHKPPTEAFKAPSGEATASADGKAAGIPEAPKTRPAAPNREPVLLPLKDRAYDPKCAWIGERVISLLIRDDADTAEKFMTFYKRFECPPARIGEAFGCVVRSPVSRKTTGTEGMSLSDVTQACWGDPSIAFSLIGETNSPDKK